jgi:hypothetical protein
VGEEHVKNLVVAYENKITRPIVSRTFHIFDTGPPRGSQEPRDPKATQPRLQKREGSQSPALY